MNKLLSFAEVFKEAGRIFRLHLSKILIIVFLVMVPLGLLSGIAGEFLLDTNALQEFAEVAQNEESTYEEVYEAVYTVAPKVVPYLLLELLAGVLSLALPIAIARLTIDEGRHGALTLNYTDGDMYVVNTEPEEVREVGSATSYFADGIKLLPRVALCVICGGIIAFLGFMIMLLPGLLVAVVTGLSCYYVVLTGHYPLKGLLGSGLVALKRPLTLLLFLLGNGASLFTSYVLSFLLSLIPLPEAYASVFTVAFTVITVCVSSVVTAFTAIAVTCSMVNALDRMGYRRNENGFMEKEVQERKNPFEQ